MNAYETKLRLWRKNQRMPSQMGTSHRFGTEKILQTSPCFQLKRQSPLPRLLQKTSALPRKAEIPLDLK